MKTEGRNAVLELLKTDKTIEKIMLEKGAQGTLGKIFAEARKRGVRVQFVDRAVLDKESATGRHQGVVAFTTAFEYSELEDLLGGENSLIVLCDGIEDVHNLGSILRVAECAGADGVVIPNAKGASVTEAVIRISAGAAEHVRVAKVPSVNRAVEELQKAGYWVYALEAGGECIYDKKLTGKVGLVVGGEDSGVRRLTREKCDGVLSIPLFGQVNSLNASVALGIAVYEVVRARLEK
ncbi:MAG TPA: 23S rRNA (guanosine(2251)-2'-O)-methyltransferase RlmB [Firmicutes bacterium]|nr:23S rRNA (guanosine(2251)-2'-O)-methyltransferase RlmB [Bacillota bacterium]